MTLADSGGSRLARWQGLVRLAGRRLLGRAKTGSFNRVTLTVVVVAVAVALLVVVTGISMGLAAESTIQGSDAEYRIVPESGTSLTSVVSVSGPQLGGVHDATDEILRIDGVRAATPVLIDVVRLRGPDSTEPEYVLGLGVVPPGNSMHVAGLPTGELTAGDPHYGSGSYDGPMTGEVLLSPAAATVLNASAGENLVVGSTTSGRVEYSGFRVTAVSDSGTRTLGGNIPVAVFHLSELQTLSGAANGDQADHVLVQSNQKGLRSQLSAVYPEATVLERGGFNAQQVVRSDLPLAISGSALLVAVLVSGLFVATTMGLEVETDRELLAVLTAVGISRRSRLLVIGATTVGLTAVGGLLGIVVGFTTAVLLNVGLGTMFGLPAVVQFHPLLAVYGFAVAIATGLVALPYPLHVARRSETVEVLGQ